MDLFEAIAVARRVMFYSSDHLRCKDGRVSAADSVDGVEREYCQRVADAYNLLGEEHAKLAKLAKDSKDAARIKAR